MREILHEHDSKLQQSDIMKSTSRMPYTTSKLLSTSGMKRDQYNISDNAQTRSASRKDMRFTQNQKQYSQSERKHSQYETVEFDPRTGAYFDRSGVKSRRALNTQFDKNINQISHYQSSANKERQGQRYSHDDVDSRPSGYSVKTVRTTVTEEFEELDDKDVTEKGAMEVPEKVTQPAKLRQKNRAGGKNVHLYGRLINVGNALTVKSLHFIF